MPSDLAIPPLFVPRLVVANRLKLLRCCTVSGTLILAPSVMYFYAEHIDILMMIHTMLIPKCNAAIFEDTFSTSN